MRAPTLNLVAAEHEQIRKASVELAVTSPDLVMDVVGRYGHALPCLPFEETTTLLVSTSATLTMPARHGLQLQDFDQRHLRSVLLSTYERAPADFETLLGLEGVGGRTLRALALVSEVIYGTPASTRDPARFAFAHGGKDGTPFPVDRASYDRTIDTLHRAMAHARVDRSDKVDALKRLSTFAKSTEPPTRATETD